MARNTIHADVPPESVWEVLADPRLYGNWVVGASTTRAVDGRWPEAGATLHHTQLMVLDDTTTVVESEPARRLVLEARTRPILVTRVELKLEPEDGGTRIVLDEEPVGGMATTAPEAVTDSVIHFRNTEAVRRLKRLAELGHALGRD